MVGAYLILGFIVVMVVLFVQFRIADEFRNIARSKGHDANRYFWFCFLFGIPGYLMVVALPDRHLADGTGSADSAESTPHTATMPSITGETADAWVGTYSLKCERCVTWQSKTNTVCTKCGATFVNFIQS